MVKAVSIHIINLSGGRGKAPHIPKLRAR